MSEPSRKEKLAMIGGMYMIPILLMIVFPFTKTIEANGEPLGAMWLMLAGFLLGVAIEGMLFIFGATLAVLMGKV